MRAIDEHLILPKKHNTDQDKLRKAVEVRNPLFLYLEDKAPTIHSLASRNSPILHYSK